MWFSILLICLSVWMGFSLSISQWAWDCLQLSSVVAFGWFVCIHVPMCPSTNYGCMFLWGVGCHQLWVTIGVSGSPPFLEQVVLLLHGHVALFLVYMHCTGKWSPPWPGSQEIKSLIDYFHIAKTKDIRPVYNGASCEVNEALWSPNCLLPIAKSTSRVLDFHYFSVDIDLGGFFLKFSFPEILRQFLGINLTPSVNTYGTMVPIGSGCWQPIRSSSGPAVGCWDANHHLSLPSIFTIGRKHSTGHITVTPQQLHALGHYFWVEPSGGGLTL
jgi:hypothetical protein